MKLQKESVKTLFLILLMQPVLWASTVGLMKSRSLSAAVKARGEQDVSFNSKVMSKKVFTDSFVPKEILRRARHLAGSSNTVATTESNACTLSDDILDQIYKPAASEWLVDDTTADLLQNDLQSMIECTQPGDRVLFSNKKMIKLSRTLEIVHELNFIGKSLDTGQSSQDEEMVPSLTCPNSEPTLSVSTTNFKAMILSIRDCTSSSVSSSAAIVLEQGSSATMDQLILKGNQNRAIYVKNHVDLVLTDSDFENNKVFGNGGAIYVEDESTINIQKTNFKGNVADNYDGGALYIDDDNLVVIKDSTFSDNTCDHDGGAIYIDDRNTLRIQGSIFSENMVPNRGGVIYLYEDNIVDVEESTFKGNVAERLGGVICVHSPNTINIIRSEFTENTAKNEGGAIHFSDGLKLSIEGSSFAHNTAISGGGGALYMNFDNFVNIDDCMFTDNTSKDDVGGVICADIDNSINIKGSTFADNTCGSNGGVIYLDSRNTLILQESTISNNLATENGGGIYLNEKNVMTTYDSSLIENTATNNGGALQLLSNNHAILVGSTISSNKATNGGALNLGNDNIVNLEQSTLSENICTMYGSVLYLGIDNVVAGFNSKITNNQAGQTSEHYNGAIYSDEEYIEVAFINSIISGNKVSEDGVTYRRSSK